VRRCVNSAFTFELQAVCAEIQKQSIVDACGRQVVDKLDAMPIMQRLAGQVRRLTERVFDFSTLAVRNRIHAELLRLARQHMDSPNTAIIKPAPTHAELACFVSTHREAVTRELSELARNRLIQRTGHELRVLDVERLRKMVDLARGPVGD